MEKISSLNATIAGFISCTKSSNKSTLSPLRIPLRLCVKPLSHAKTFQRQGLSFGSILSFCMMFFLSLPAVYAGHIRVGVFEADVTPPIGSPVAYAITRSVTEPLTAKGIIVFKDNEKPIVLCAVDWIGIANEGQDIWKEKLAAAAHTTPDRVSVHALHQHDGVNCDFTMERILREYGITNTPFDTAFQYRAIQNVADAVARAYLHPQEVTHIGFGQAKVEKVASNRRIMGSDGKVAIVRYSSSTDPKAIAAPEGLIDPWLKCVSLWNGEIPITVMTYYATHPQSHYGKGDVTCEFIGIARNARETALGGLPHIHFNGAGGNIAAGKYNNGEDSVRVILAKRVEKAMLEAWNQTKKTPLTMKDVIWTSTPVDLPLGENIIEKELRATLADTSKPLWNHLAAAEKLGWLQRSRDGAKITVSSLQLGKIWLLNLPGELFVEYQLAAQKMKPGNQVCTAAYEEYGPGYIGVAKSYGEGGYETSDLSSGTSPEVEEILMTAIKKVLK